MIYRGPWTFPIAVVRQSISWSRHVQRASTLSGIHHGLRGSARERSPKWLKNSKGPNSKGPKSKGSDSKHRVVPTAGDKFKQTRRKRFHDPESSFGKDSLVYRLKFGDLKDRAETLLAKKEAGRGAKNAGGGARNAGGGWEEMMARSQLEEQDPRGSRFSGRERRSRGPGRAEKPGPVTRRSSARQDWTERSSRGSSRAERPGPPRDRSSPRGDWEERSPRGSSRAERPRPARDRLAPRGDWSERSSRGSSRAEQPGPTWDRSPRGDRTERSSLGPSRDRTERHSWGPTSAEEPGSVRDRSAPRGDRMERSSRGSSRAETGEPVRDRSAPRGDRTEAQDIVSIHYTTAASQFLYGKSVVRAALMSDRRKLYKLYVLGGASRSEETDQIWQLGQRRQVPVEVVDERKIYVLDKMSEGRPHNGYILEASPLRQVPIHHLGPLGPNPWEPHFTVEPAHQSREEAAINNETSADGDTTTATTTVPLPSGNGRKPLVLFLHQVADPQNLGALIRSARFLGAAAVVISRDGSAPLSSAALKASAGAAEDTPLFIAQNGREFLVGSTAAGWRSFAAVTPPPPSATWSRKEQPAGGGKVAKSLADIETENPLASHPCILVLANEGVGLPRPVRAVCDEEVFVPGGSGDSGLDSLNVSVAGGVLSHAFLRSRPKSKPIIAKPTAVESPTPESTTEDRIF